MCRIHVSVPQSHQIYVSMGFPILHPLVVTKWRCILLLLVLLLSDEIVAEDPPFPPERTIAVFITGLRSRFLLNTILQHLIYGCVRDGWAIHIYLSLIGFNMSQGEYKGFRIAPDPNTVRMNNTIFNTHIRKSIRAAGGDLIFYEHRHGPEKLDPLPTEPGSYIFRKRLSQYSPYYNAIGRAILRLWKSRELMWNASLAYERARGVQYARVLWTRDDAYWVQSLDLTNFTDPNALYTRNCVTYHGINDKTIMLGREAAPALMTAYSAFWNKTLPLESQNAERYLMYLAKARGVVVRYVKFQRLPTLDAMVDKSNQQICIKKYYSCLLEPPPWGPPFCKAREYPRGPEGLQKWPELWPMPAWARARALSARYVGWAPRGIDRT